jgi:alkanesulfonate monooxygenase SsuD/methylene tetrahydromethanopterin reductase-like flavin-dependent oxidoreductase (luciferase family)
MQVGMALPVTVAGLWDEPGTLESWARAVDEGPFASIGFGTRIAGDIPDLVALSGAVAAWTRRVRIRVAVTPQLYDPVQLAKSLATVDRLSEGRLEVSLGVGGRDDDYRALGVDPTTQNVHQLADRARAMRWTWHGDHLTDTVRPVGPPPVRPEGPELLISSYGRQAALSAAPWAGGLVHVVSGPGDEELEEVADVFKQARERWAEVGRPPPRLVTSFWFAVDEAAPYGARAQVREHVLDYLDYVPRDFAEGLAERAGFAGSAAGLALVLERIAALGADEVHLIPTGLDVEQVARVAEVVGS